jgi:MFS family permease
MARSIFGLLTGLISSVLVIALVEMMSLAVYTPPAGYDPANPGTIMERPMEVTTGELLLVVIAFILGSIAGGLAIGVVGGKRERLFTMILGILLMVLGFFKLLFAPESPVWFWILTLSVFIPFSLIGLNLAHKIPKRTSDIMPN